MALHTIRLELARNKEFPEGSPRHGYEFVAPLDEEGRFDAPEWKANKSACVVRRFWGDQPEEKGLLIHTRAKNWAFSYVPSAEEDDEPIFRFDRHVFRHGEYVSVTEHDGVQRAFQITAIH